MHEQSSFNTSLERTKAFNSHISKKQIINSDRKCSLGSNNMCTLRLAKHIMNINNYSDNFIQMICI